MLLDCSDLSPFEPTLRRIARTAFTHGLDGLQQTRHTLDDIRTNPTVHRKFIRDCHYGFNQAQSHVVEEVLLLEERARAAKSESRPNDADDVRHARRMLRRVIRNRQVVLRRIIDAILFQVLYPEHRAIRYFSIEKRLRGIDPDVLRKTADTAHRLNRGHRLKFSVICDLTTMAHVGDLVQVDRSDLVPGQWQVIELKDGTMHKTLSNILAQKQRRLSPDDLNELAQSLGSKAAQQAQRMLRQEERVENFRAILETDRGVLPISGDRMAVGVERHYIGDYMGAVVDAAQTAAKDGFALHTVDQCLRIVAVRRDENRSYAHHALGVAHALYHATSGDSQCRLGNADEATTEFTEIQQFLSGVVDLVLHNMRDAMGYPLFLLGASDPTIDLIMRRVFVFVHFDFTRFFALARDEGITLEWATNKQTQQARPLSTIIPGSPGAYGVRVSRSSSQSDVSGETLLFGFFRRAFGDFTPPSELIALLRNPPQMGQEPSQLPSSPDNSGRVRLR